MAVFILFCVALFTVIYSIVYAPIYLISYEIFHIDRIINDNKLVWVLLFFAFLITLLLFPVFFNLIKWFII